MTGNDLLLDTNVVIELFKGNVTIMTNLGSRQLVDIPYVVLGELLLGARRSSNVEKHLSQVNDFLKKCNVIRADAETADSYAIIKTALLKKGRPIPENDIWIAAIVKQHNYTLITRDRHFGEVDGLNVVNWF